MKVVDKRKSKDQLFSEVLAYEAFHTAGDLRDNPNDLTIWTKVPVFSVVCSGDGHVNSISVDGDLEHFDDDEDVIKVEIEVGIIN